MRIEICTSGSQANERKLERFRVARSMLSFNAWYSQGKTDGGINAQGLRLVSSLKGKKAAKACTPALILDPDGPLSVLIISGEQKSGVGDRRDL